MWRLAETARWKRRVPRARFPIYAQASVTYWVRPHGRTADCLGLLIANIIMQDRLMFEECCESLLYFFRRHIFLTGCDEPDVAERIFQSAVAVAVELALNRLQYFRSGVVSLTDNRIRIFDVKMNFHWRPAERLRAAMVGFWVLIGKHNHRASDSDLGVPDLSVGFCQPIDLSRSEGFFVKLYGRGRVIDAQVRRRALAAIRNRFHFGPHKFSPLCQIGSASITLNAVGGANTIRSMRRPAVSSSARNSASVRSRPPVITSMFRSLPTITPSCDDDPTLSGTVGSMMSNRAPFLRSGRSGIAARHFLNIVELCSSSQSCMTLFRIYVSAPAGTDSKKLPARNSARPATPLSASSRVAPSWQCGKSKTLPRASG